MHKVFIISGSALVLVSLAMIVTRLFDDGSVLTYRVIPAIPLLVGYSYYWIGKKKKSVNLSLLISLFIFVVTVISYLLLDVIVSGTSKEWGPLVLYVIVIKVVPAAIGACVLWVITYAVGLLWCILESKKTRRH